MMYLWYGENGQTMYRAKLIDSGHHMAEEAPDETYQELHSFFCSEN